jgi:peroxiredoxin
LADFQQNLAKLDELGVDVFALSTDLREHAEKTIAKNGVTYPVLYGMDGPQTAATLDTLYEPERDIIQPTGFIMRPDHTIMSKTLSNGPVGRLFAADAMRYIRFLQKQALRLDV